MANSGASLEGGGEIAMNPNKFTYIDYLLFSSSLVVSVAIGLYSAYRSRGKASTQEFLLGGREMAPVPVALSLIGGVISAVSIIGLATEMYYFGTQLSISLVGSVSGVLFVRRFLLPVFYPLKLVSLNEYIGLRFKSQGLRKVVATESIILSFIYIGFYLYTSSLTLSTVTNHPTWASILIMGSICTFYITIGGVKAVVYTDVVQTLLMFGGVLAVVIICCIKMGGFKSVWHIAEQGERIQFFNMDPSPFVRHTFWSVFIFGMYCTINLIGLSQATFQRFTSVKTLAISKRLCFGFIVGLLCLWLNFYFSGLVAYATYSNCDPLASGKIEKPDQILPFLVTDELSYVTGMSGLFVAAIYGGVLSSFSSAANSVACQIWEDLLKDLRFFKTTSDSRATVIVKMLSAGTGMIGMTLGLLVGQLGNIFHIFHILLGTVTGPVSGLYLAGIFTPWVNMKGASVGLLVGFIFNIWLVIGKFMHGGGSPQMLPLSTEGCLENTNSFLYTNTTSPFLSNMTMAGSFALSDSNWTDGNTSLPFPSISPIRNGSSVTSHSMYDISYCYNGPIGFLITMVVSSLLSVCTGLVQPEDVEPRLVNHSCLRLHWKLHNLFRRRQTSSSGSCPDDNPVLDMLPRTTFHEKPQQ